MACLLRLGLHSQRLEGFLLRLEPWPLRLETVSQRLEGWPLRLTLHSQRMELRPLRLTGFLLRLTRESQQKTVRAESNRAAGRGLLRAVSVAPYNSAAETHADDEKTSP